MKIPDIAIVFKTCLYQLIEKASLQKCNKNSSVAHHLWKSSRNLQKRTISNSTQLK